VLVDGRDTLPGLAIPCSAIIGGDAKSVSIAAASIVAKVIRDRMMKKIAEECPGYGWHNNKGYPSADHRSAILRIGGTPHHRLSFAPFKNGTLDLFDR
jgi:ribonuclease HII